MGSRSALPPVKGVSVNGASSERGAKESCPGCEWEEKPRGDQKRRALASAVRVRASGGAFPPKRSVNRTTPAGLPRFSSRQPLKTPSNSATITCGARGGGAWARRRDVRRWGTIVGVCRQMHMENE
eukprot:scaffold1526_cov88-Isochrysis_galbana.AAC.4